MTGNEEMENYRMALAYISKQSSDQQSRELAETALNAFPDRGLPQSPDLWRPIETAPRDGTIILLGNVGSEPRPAYYGMADRTFGAGSTKRFPWTFLDETNGLNHMTDDETGPTHWRPMPSPPLQSPDTRPDRLSQEG